MHGEAYVVLCIRPLLFVVMGFRPGGQGKWRKLFKWKAGLECGKLEERV